MHYFGYARGCRSKSLNFTSGTKPLESKCIRVSKCIRLSKDATPLGSREIYADGADCFLGTDLDRNGDCAAAACDRAIRGAHRPCLSTITTVPAKIKFSGVIPNYREAENSKDIQPLTPRQKLRIAFDDSFDPSAFLVAGVFAGSSMAQRQYDFGNGIAGFAKYYGGAFADQAIGNIMSEGLFPIALKQDPRYFPKARGSFWARSGYALSREVITRGDNGENQFNTCWATRSRPESRAHTIPPPIALSATPQTSGPSKSPSMRHSMS